jgi:hypothetical protein
MESIDNSVPTPEVNLEQLEAKIAAIEALLPHERNDVELIEQLRILKQKAVQIKMDLTNPS